MLLSETKLKKFLFFFSLFSLLLLTLAIFLTQPNEVLLITNSNINQTILLKGIPENIQYKNSKIYFTINNNKVISSLPLPENSFLCIKGKVSQSLTLYADEVYIC